MLSIALARTVFHMLSTKQPYTDEVFSQCDQQANICATMRLSKQAAELGFKLMPLAET